MTNTIRIKNTNVAGRVPTTSNLQVAELGLNTTDKKLYSSDGTNIFEIGNRINTVFGRVGDITLTDSDIKTALTYTPLPVTSYNSLNTDITSLISGSLFGSLIEGSNSGHFVIGIRGNDAQDGFHIIDKGNATTSLTDPYLNRLFSVSRSLGVNSTLNITAPSFIGSLTGNANTATTLQTARTIALSGAATGTATSFNGSANITIPVTDLNASNLSSGTVPDGRLNSSYTGIISLSANLLTSSSGIKIGGSYYPSYEANIDFSSDPANTWRRLVNVVCSSVLYSTIGFCIEIIDPQGNHAPINTVHTIKKETYYVACVRSESTILDSPDACYVTGPSNRIRAVKTSIGTYEIQIQNATTYREYKVFIYVYASNGNHIVNYYAGDTASGGISQYNSAVSNSATEVFQNINVVGSITGSITGNASTATTLQTPRTINGTSFNGSTNITTSSWGTSRTITLGQTSISVDGSSNITRTRDQILGTPPTTGAFFSNTPPIVDSNGVLEIGRYIDFHSTNTTTADFDVRVDCSAPNAITFYGTASVTLTAGSFAGSGASLTSLNASNLSSGIVPDARISGSYTGLTNLTGSGTATFAVFKGTNNTGGWASLQTGSATQAGLLQIYKSDGTTRLGYIGWSNTDLTYASENGANHIFSGGIVNITNTTATGSTTTGALVVTGGIGVGGGVTAIAFAGNGGALTSLNASQLTAGTIPDARLTGSYTGLTNLTGSGTATFNKYQATGLSTSWGVTSGVNTGGLNTVMGTSTGATWLLSGTSGGVFRYGIQGLDSGNSLRFYAGANSFYFNNDTLYANAFSGSGASLTSLNASQLTAGTVPNDRITGAYDGITTLSQTGLHTITVAPAGNGILLDANLAADSINTLRDAPNLLFRSKYWNGTANTNYDARLNFDITAPAEGKFTFDFGGVEKASISSSGNISATSFTGSGSSLISLNASNLSSGTIPDARISGDYTGISNLAFTAAGTSGLRFWGSDAYKIYMAPQTQSGAGRLDSTSDYNIYFRIGGGTNRGFVFQNNTSNLLQIESAGTVTAKGTIRSWSTLGGYSALVSGNATQSGYLGIYNSSFTRLGYIGYSNVNLTYVTEGGADHVFSGGIVSISNTTASTSTTTGALVVSGGMGVAGTINSNIFAGNSSDSVTAPSFTWTGDTNTGMYHPAADQVGFTAGGTNAMVLTTTYQMNYGNIYITSPDNIAADATTTTRDSGGLYLRGFYWNGTASTIHDWNILNDITAVTPSSTLRFRAAGIDKLTVDNTGTVTATLFSGSGASLTNLNASNLISGNIPAARLGSTDYSNFNNVGFTGVDGYGIRFFNSDSYKIYMSSWNSATWGGRLDSTSDYNMYFKMTGGTNRGFVFENSTTPVAQIDGNGNIYLSGALLMDGNLVIDAGGGWHRSYGDTGWYNGTYAGGMYMIDTTWVRTYNNKSLYSSNNLGVAGAITVINGVTPNNGAIRLTPNLHLNSGGTTNSVIVNWDSGGSVATDKMFRVGNGNSDDTMYVRRDGFTSIIGTLRFAGGGGVPTEGNCGVITWNSINGGQGTVEFVDYCGTGGSTCFAFYRVPNIGKPTTSNIIASINQAGTYNVLSDERVKKDIKDIEYGLNTVLALKPRKYNHYVNNRFNNGKVENGEIFISKIGLIAQEVGLIIPEIVEKPENEKEGFYSLDYTSLIPILIKAIQEQQDQIEVMKDTIKLLMSRINRLENIK